MIAACDASELLPNVERAHAVVDLLYGHLSDVDESTRLSLDLVGDLLGTVEREMNLAIAAALDASTKTKVVSSKLAPAISTRKKKGAASK